MNRFDSYMRGAKLARMNAMTAKEKLAKGDQKMALGYLVAAVEGFIVATNNIAHLKFNPRKKNPHVKTGGAL